MTGSGINDLAGDRGCYSGERALIVGATGGIGRAFVTELLDRGADVALTYHRQHAAAEALRADAEGRGRRCSIHVVDLRDRAGIEACCTRIVAELGVPTIVVNCAGVLRDAPFVRLDDEDWDLVLDTNVSGPFRFLRQLVPLMIRSGRGRIVNVASVSGMFGMPGQANYAASKGGLIALTRALARELGAFNITVNAIAPGFVETEMTAPVSEAQRRRLLERIPLRRFATPADIACAARVLMQAESAYVNGHVLVVDGGLTS